MKFLKSYKLYENSESKTYQELMGEMLHLYSSIPLPKEKASVVISNIIYDTNGRYYELGEDINLEYQKSHDKIRFKDYFDSLISSKDSRGHNYEGTLAGLYNGKLSKRGERWDVVINNKTWSVKFVNGPNKAPEIGSFKEILDNYNLSEDVLNAGGLSDLFKSDNYDLKSKVFDIITEEITGGWIIAYPDDVISEQETSDKKEGDEVIRQHILTLDDMRELLMSGYTVSSKLGLKSVFRLALSSRYKYESTNISDIILPTLSLEELINMSKSKSESEWAKNVFGKYGSKIRPDVLRYIRNNSDEISDKLKKFKDFNYDK